MDVVDRPVVAARCRKPDRRLIGGVLAESPMRIKKFSKIFTDVVRGDESYRGFAKTPTYENP